MEYRCKAKFGQLTTLKTCCGVRCCRIKHCSKTKPRVDIRTKGSVDEHSFILMHNAQTNAPAHFSLPRSFAFLHFLPSFTPLFSSSPSYRPLAPFLFVLFIMSGNATEVKFVVFLQGDKGDPPANLCAFTAEDTKLPQSPAESTHLWPKEFKLEEWTIQLTPDVPSWVFKPLIASYELSVKQSPLSNLEQEMSSWRTSMIDGPTPQDEFLKYRYWFAQLRICWIRMSHFLFQVHQYCRYGGNEPKETFPSAHGPRLLILLTEINKYLFKKPSDVTPEEAQSPLASYSAASLVTGPLPGDSPTRDQEFKDYQDKFDQFREQLDKLKAFVPLKAGTVPPALEKLKDSLKAFNPDADALDAMLAEMTKPADWIPRTKDYLEQTLAPELSLSLRLLGCSMADVSFFKTHTVGQRLLKGVKLPVGLSTSHTRLYPEFFLWCLPPGVPVHH